MGIKESLIGAGRTGLLIALVGTAAYSAKKVEPLHAVGIEQPSASLAEHPPLTGLETEPAPPKESIPLEVILLMRNNYLKTWRNALPIDTGVTIIDFGEARHSGPILPKEGLKLREHPTTDSKTARLVQWLRAGQEVNFRNLISIFNPKTGDEESWIVVDEKGQPGARWYCGRGWPRSHARCFAAARIGDEVFIDLTAIMPPPAEQIRSFPWPRSK
ncbi:MAG: hypothetical protein Q8P89_01150 [bacterium]|nr:hypothetical protein [bacterium]